MSEALQADPSPKKSRGIAARSRPGMARVGGRQKGTPNKIDGDIKRMVIHALHYAGGVDYLTAQAHKHPVAFLGLVGRVLPLQVTGENGNKIHIVYSWADEPASQQPSPPVIEANAEPAVTETNDDEAVAVSFDGE